MIDNLRRDIGAISTLTLIALIALMGFGISKLETQLSLFWDGNPMVRVGGYYEVAYSALRISLEVAIATIVTVGIIRSLEQAQKLQGSYLAACIILLAIGLPVIVMASRFAFGCPFQTECAGGDMITKFLFSIISGAGGGAALHCIWGPESRPGSGNEAATATNPEVWR